MSDEHMAGVAEKLELLKQRFKHRALDDIQAVLSAVRGADRDPVSRDGLSLAYQGLHRLAGSAGTFGFHALGDEARSLELMLKPYLEVSPGGFPASSDSFDQILTEQFFHRIERMAELLTVEEGRPAQFDRSQSRAEDAASQPVAIIIEPDEEACESLAAALAPHGFTVHCAASADRVSRNVSDASVILVRNHCLTAPDARFAIKAGMPPVICMGSEDAFDDRYQLAAYGVDGFVSEPVNVPVLADYMEQLISERTNHHSDRVLVVDDDPELLEHYGVVLEAAGFDVRKVSSPPDMLGVLSEFRPDIVLMDIQMGAYSGLTLARMLRFDPQWVGLHIVFLSSEEDRDFQFNALAYGGDDFLTKPVSDRILVQAAKVRCYRAKQLDKLASRDSLTGLLKHSLAMSEISKEHSRCQRLGLTSVVAMLDLDHFKQVNDQYGHRIGDLVIKGLSNLLRHRLRKTDVIGRYGGEEFIVAMHGCSVQDASQSLKGICEQMASIAFPGGNREFFVTLSVGVAALDAYDSADAAIEAADRALYQRKSAGRNGVTIDQETVGPGDP